MGNYLDELKSKFSKEFGIEIGQKELDDGLVQQIISTLLPHVARFTTIPEGEFRNRLRKVVLSRKAMINGYTRTYDNWRSFEIGIGWGLCIFLHKMTKLMLSRMELHDGKRVVDPTRISEETTLASARRLLSAFWDCSIFQVPSIPITAMSKSQIELAAYLLHHAECFVVAHELGHIILNITPEDRVHKERLIAGTAAKNSVGVYLDKYSAGGREIAIANTCWTNELASDLIGLKLCLSTRDDSIGRIIIRAAIRLFFIAVEMLEDFWEKTKGLNYWAWHYQRGGKSKEEALSHPPTRVRMEFLKSYVDARFGSEANDYLGDIFFEWKRYLMSKV